MSKYFNVDKLSNNDLCKIENIYYDIYYNIKILSERGFIGYTTEDNLIKIDIFKIGELVKVIEGHDGNDEIKNKIGRIIKIDKYAKDLDIEFKENIKGWGYDCNKWNVPFSKVVKYDDSIKVGDKVKLNKKATIEDFTKNYWNHCQLDTLDFIEKEGDSDKIFDVISKIDNDCVCLKRKSDYDDYDYKYYDNVNINILEKIEEDVKDMTIEEISKELGYKIKIKKEK